MPFIAKKASPTLPYPHRDHGEVSTPFQTGNLLNQTKEGSIIKLSSNKQKAIFIRI
jgi:hypothetical protein